MAWRSIVTGVGGALAALAAACSSGRLTPDQIGASDSLPPWDYAYAARAVTNPRPQACSDLPPRGTPVALRLLAWRTFDQGSNRREDAYWWASYVTPDGPRWLLAMTRRRNGEPWRFVDGVGPCESRRAAFRLYDDPPTNAEAVELLRAVRLAVAGLPDGIDAGDWFRPTILPSSRVRLRDVAVRANTWYATFGAPPPAEFRP